MDKTISLDFRFRKDNKEIANFAESFLHDLRICLSRFKVKVAQAEPKASGPDTYVIIFISQLELDDQKFISEINSFADSGNSILINTDPLKSNDKRFPQHKFRIFRFWDEIKETSEVRLFRRSALEHNALYWERITDISIEIAERFSVSADVKMEKIFIAQTDNAQSSDRDNLVRDLEEMGYEVIPDHQLSSDFNECTESIKKQLSGCKLIIHPIPLVYSKYFTDKQISVVEHQFTLSSQYAADKQHDVKRIIWIPSDFEITEEENQIFVEKIQRDQDQKNNTMVLKVTLEELKKIYSKILSGVDVDFAGDKLPDIYFVADNDDEKTGEKVISSNNSKGMNVNWNFKGITYNQHLKYLANSEFVIINYTAENEPWFTMKVNDIFKSKGVSSAKPFKKVILVKEKKELNTSAFENRFSEVHVGSLESLKLNLAVNNN
jgi:hypothetical protein